MTIKQANLVNKLMNELEIRLKLDEMRKMKIILDIVSQDITRLENKLWDLEIERTSLLKKIKLSDES